MVNATKVVLGILIAAVFGFGVYMIVLGVRVSNIGHPSYKTERGEESTSFAHTRINCHRIRRQTPTSSMPCTRS